MGRARDLTGQRFGRLTANRIVGKSKQKLNVWECTCSCGSTSRVRSDQLRSGNTKSCGCLERELSGERLKLGASKHGGAKDALPEYQAWANLRGDFPVPAEWDDFVQFYCDVGERPSPEHRLARRNYTNPHGPNNTYWRNAIDYADLTATDLGSEFVLDLRSICLEEATAQAGKAAA